MSVTTTFDIKLLEAKQNIDNAYSCLWECLRKDTWGYEDITEQYIDKVLECLKMLLDIKRKL